MILDGDYVVEQENSVKYYKFELFMLLIDLIKIQNYLIKEYVLRKIGKS